MERTELDVYENNEQNENSYNSHMNGIETSSVVYENSIWPLLEELEELRPYKITDFQKEYFIPDFL